MARIDPVQLNKLELIASPQGFAFSIERTIKGDLVDDVEFILLPAQTAAY